MRKMAAIIFFVLFAVALPAYAGVQNGFGVGMGYDHAMKSGPFASFNLRLRALSVTPLELEMQYLAPRGLGAQVNVYILHTKWVKWSLVNPGVYFPVGTKMINNKELKRTYDLSVGTALEVKTWRNLVAFVSARWYLPDPSAVASEAKRRGEKAGNADQSFGSGIDTTIDFVKDTYLRSAKDWHITAGAMWFF